MADFRVRVIVPLDREAARQRLAKKRARYTAERVSAELRHAAARLREWAAEPSIDRWAPAAVQAFGPALAAHLDAVAADMDDYLDTRAQASGGDADHPVWQGALALARLINPKEAHDA